MELRTKRSQGRATCEEEEEEVLLDALLDDTPVPQQQYAARDRSARLAAIEARRAQEQANTSSQAAYALQQGQANLNGIGQMVVSPPSYNQVVSPTDGYYLDANAMSQQGAMLANASNQNRSAAQTAQQARLAQLREARLRQIQAQKAQGLATAAAEEERRLQAQVAAQNRAKKKAELEAKRTAHHNTQIAQASAALMAGHQSLKSNAPRLAPVKQNDHRIASVVFNGQANALRAEAQQSAQQAHAARRQAMQDRLAAKRVNQIFKKYDVDGSGALDRDEAKWFVEEMLGISADDFSYIEQAFAEFDADHSGSLSKNEIVAFIKQRSNLLPRVQPLN
jgi:ribosomal protein S8E